VSSATLADGRRYGVTGTPAFFINGQLISGAQPFAAFKAQLDVAFRR
jgi:protein-disulfide isomerase